MTGEEAEKIVQDYGGAIAKGTDGNVVRRKIWLPYSKATIKQAYFEYISAIILELHGLPKDIGTKLVLTYSMLNTFIDDESADELIAIEKLMDNVELFKQNPQYKELSKKYFDYVTETMHDGQLYDEINEYIGECYNKHGIKNN